MEHLLTFMCALSETVGSVRRLDPAACHLEKKVAKIPGSTCLNWKLWGLFRVYGGRQPPHHLYYWKLGHTCTVGLLPSCKHTSPAPQIYDCSQRYANQAAKIHRSNSLLAKTLGILRRGSESPPYRNPGSHIHTPQALPQQWSDMIANLYRDTKSTKIPGALVFWAENAVFLNGSRQFSELLEALPIPTLYIYLHISSSSTDPKAHDCIWSYDTSKLFNNDTQ